MPLLDHFHAPLFPTRRWESFHARWASAISDALNANLLPKEYFAEIQSHVGSRVEVDVATFRGSESRGRDVPDAGSGGVAVLERKPWSPPIPAIKMPAIYPDSIEVLVYGTRDGSTVVAAVELISPGNKDRPDTRKAFAAKCATYLQQGIGLMIIDVVTDRSANLHNELVELLDVGEKFQINDAELYAVAYRPIRRPDVEHTDVWVAPLAVGKPLPLLPLALDRQICIPLDLESPYVETCRHSRLP
jgi:hypothetical protein